MFKGSRGLCMYARVAWSSAGARSRHVAQNFKLGCFEASTGSRLKLLDALSAHSMVLLCAE
eukprot:6587226-Prymnesium_polylepis.1